MCCAIFSKVAYIATLIEPLADAVIGFASKLPGGTEKQTEILDTAKTVAESASQLIYAAKDAGGNPKVEFSYVIDFLVRLLLYCYFYDATRS